MKSALFLIVLIINTITDSTCQISKIPIKIIPYPTEERIGSENGIEFSYEVKWSGRLPPWYDHYIDVKGNVKSILTIVYNGKMKFGEFQIQNINHYIYNRFDINGCLIEINKYDSDSILTNRTINKYDEQRKIISSNIYYSVPPTYINDDSTVVERRYKFTYSKDGSLVEKSVYDSQDNILRKLKNNFDIHGDLIECNDYNSEGELIGKFLFHKDTQGICYMEKFDDWVNRNQFKIRYSKKYDSYGKLVEEIDEIASFPVGLKTIYGYDTYGSVISEISRTNDKSNRNDHFNKDKFYKYDYDSTGNWIKKYDFENQTPTGYTVRIINYY